MIQVSTNNWPLRFSEMRSLHKEAPSLCCVAIDLPLRQSEMFSDYGQIMGQESSNWALCPGHTSLSTPPSPARSVVGDGIYAQGLQRNHYLPFPPFSAPGASCKAWGRWQRPLWSRGSAPGSGCSGSARPGTSETPTLVARLRIRCMRGWSLSTNLWWGRWNRWTVSMVCSMGTTRLITRKSFLSPWPMKMQPQSTRNLSFWYVDLRVVRCFEEKLASRSPGLMPENLVR